MTLGDAKKKVIAIINSKSSGGTLITDANNADYLLRVNDLFNPVVNELSKITKILGTKAITQVADTTIAVQKYSLTGYLSMNRIIYEEDATSYMPFFTDYLWEQPNVLVIPASYDGNFTVEYWKTPTAFPTAIVTNTADSQAFEIPDDAVEVGCFKVAGDLIFEDNENLAGKCYADYEKGKLRLIPTNNPAPQKIVDVYGGFN